MRYGESELYRRGGRTRVKYYTDRSKSDCDRKEKPESINN